jgi:hypothetical protein
MCIATIHNTYVEKTTDRFQDYNSRASKKISVDLLQYY